jgi:hypothetical protein
MFVQAFRPKLDVQSFVAPIFNLIFFTFSIFFLCVLIRFLFINVSQFLKHEQGKSKLYDLIKSCRYFCNVSHEKLFYDYTNNLEFNQVKCQRTFHFNNVWCLTSSSNKCPFFTYILKDSQFCKSLHYMSNLRLRFILLEIFAKYFLLINKIIIFFSCSDMLWYFCNECEIKENGKMKVIFFKRIRI